MSNVKSDFNFGVPPLYLYDYWIMMNEQLAP